MSKLVMELVQTSYIGRTFIAFYRVAEYGQVLQNSALACAENDSTNLATLAIFRLFFVRTNANAACVNGLTSL